MARLTKKNYTFLNRYTYYIPTVADLFILLVWFIAGILLANVITLAFAAAGSAAREVSILVAYPIMFLPAMIYASYKSQSNSMNKSGVKVDSRNFEPKGAVLCTALVVIGTLALGFCSDAITSILPEMPEWLEDMLSSMTQGTVWINFLCVSIFAPIFEEWLCRGMVMRGLLHNGSKPVWAIIISSIFFAVIHANPWQAVPALMLGAFFGLVYYKTGSLKLTMLMHFTNNTFALILGNIDSTKDIESWREFIDGPEYWVYLGVSVLLVALIVKTFLGLPDKHEKGGMDPVPCLFEQ
ncbi:MAG: CPBP family intramembrane metalloprotease [Bacteroidia bacterium]|nr:CPBP family intramembrane metalloprotease [Bacteroidia bacterium]